MSSVKKLPPNWKDDKPIMVIEPELDSQGSYCTITIPPGGGIRTYQFSLRQDAVSFLHLGDIIMLAVPMVHTYRGEKLTKGGWSYHKVKIMEFSLGLDQSNHIQVKATSIDEAP